MKHIFFALIAQAAVCSGLMAQTAITAGFGTATVEGGYQFEFSIGEMSNVETVNISAPGQLMQITQGFLQPQAKSDAKSRTAAAPLFSLSVFPNPATDRIELAGNWDTNETVQCKIFNATGQVVWTQEIVGNTATFLLDHFSSGVYFLKMEVEGQQQSLRFVKRN